MRGAATKLRRLSLAAALLLSASAQVIAGEAKFPIDGAYGTPLACALYNIGGAGSVISGGGGAAESFDFPESDYPDDELILIEPTQLTAIELRCVVVGSRGNEVDLDCAELDTGTNDDEITKVSVSPSDDGLDLLWGNEVTRLNACQPPQ